MKLTLKKKLFLILLTATGVSLTSCGKEGHTDMYSVSLTKLSQASNDETLLDEIMALQEDVAVREPKDKYTYNKDLVESLDRLELYTKRLVQLKEAGIKDKDEESEKMPALERQQILLEITSEELGQLIEKYQSNDLTDEEKSIIETELEFLFDHDQTWLQVNGRELMLSGLTRTIKAAACTISGGKVSAYDNCSYEAEDNKKQYQISVPDEIWNIKKYIINEDSGVFYECLELIDSLSRKTRASSQELAQGISIMKECIVSPVTTNDDNVIVPTITKEAAIQKVKSYK